MVAGCNHFEFFIAKLYSLYHQSAKNVRLLEEAAADLNMQILKIGQIFTIRWVANSFNTVKAVWNNYHALARHFKIASEDACRNDTERKKFLALSKHLTNSGFLLDLACMKDILLELQGLSLKCQQRDITLVDASCHILTIDILKAMKASGGKSTQKAQQHTSLELFKDVQLVEGTGKKKRNQLYQSVIDNLTRRMPESDLLQMLKPWTSAIGHRIGML